MKKSEFLQAGSAHHMNSQKEAIMQIRQTRRSLLDRPIRLCVWKKAMSIGTNKTSTEMKICILEPVYQIMRDREAKTAVSSVDMTLLHANNGDKRKVKTARIRSLLGALSICGSSDIHPFFKTEHPALASASLFLSRILPFPCSLCFCAIGLSLLSDISSVKADCTLIWAYQRMPCSPFCRGRSWFMTGSISGALSYIGRSPNGNAGKLTAFSARNFWQKRSVFCFSSFSRLT